jgi:DNA-directed RNA polymerases I and III subunit RPAC2
VVNHLLWSLSLRSPDVEFCGYTIPHPSEAKMHLRIQTWGACWALTHLSAAEGLHADQLPPDDTGTSAFDALRKGCDDLIDFCEATTVTFNQALEDFTAEQGEQS